MELRNQQLNVSSRDEEGNHLRGRLTLELDQTWSEVEYIGKDGNTFTDNMEKRVMPSARNLGRNNIVIDRETQNDNNVNDKPCELINIEAWLIDPR